MKCLRSFFMVAVILLFSANMIIALSINIKNKLNNRLLLKLTEGRTVELPPRGVATVNEQDMETPQLKALIKNGSVVIISLTDNTNKIGRNRSSSGKNKL